MTAPDYEALAREVKQRRRVLRLSQADLAAHGGPSDFTVRKVERCGPAEATVRRIERQEATTLRANTKAQLELALQWPRGLVDRILDGTASRDDLDAVVGPQPHAPAAGTGTGLGQLATITLAAELIDRLTWHEQTPAVQAAMHSLLAAMPALVCDRSSR